jgi:hypothetical protein
MDLRFVYSGYVLIGDILLFVAFTAEGPFQVFPVALLHFLTSTGMCLLSVAIAQKYRLT